VATRIPGHDEAVVDGVTGILVDDVEGMVDGLDRLLGDDELRARFANAAREHAVANSWARCAEIVLTALADDARRRARPG
jgi:glycosyltransferase involved in cell wall biosynthesis